MTLWIFMKVNGDDDNPIEILHLKACSAKPDHLKLITQKSQTATRPADLEEVPSKPMSKPTPEHPVGHPIVPTQKDTARNTADPQCFRFFSAVFYYSLIYIYKALTSYI